MNKIYIDDIYKSFEESINMFPPILCTITTQVLYCISCILGASVFAEFIGTLYTAWQRANMQLEDEKWLRDNCRDPVFYTNLKSYTSVCTKVETNARVGAFWMALHNVTENMNITWNSWIFGYWVGIVLAVGITISCFCSKTLSCKKHRNVKYYNKDCMI